MNPSSNDLLIAETGAKNAQAMYEAINAKNIALYNSNTAAGHPSPLPTIFTFNPDLYITLSMEQSANPGLALDWSECVTMSAYVPPATPQPGTSLPTAVVQPVGVDFPGWYELAPDSLSIPAGTKVEIGGATYAKGQYGNNPMGPLMGWQKQ